MPENPYNHSTLRGSAVECASSRTVDVLDSTTQDQIPIGGMSSVVSVDLQTGTRVFTERQIRVRSTDGRLLDPAEQVFRCLCGCKNAPLLTRVSVTFCGQCQAPLFLAHAKTWDDGIVRQPACPPCWRHHRWQRLLLRFCRWLTKH